MKCDTNDKSKFSFMLGNNDLYSPGAKAKLSICGKAFEFDSWMKTGLDPGTTLTDSATITADDIVKMGIAAITPA